MTDREMGVDNKRILVIDDDKEIWRAYQDVLSPATTSVDSPLAQAFLEEVGESSCGDEKRFDLSFASQGQEGYAMVQEAVEQGNPYAVIFLDIRMPPGWDGMETAVHIRQVDPQVELVVVTAFSDRSRSEIARALGTPAKFLFFRKPFDVEELRQLALSLTEKWNVARREQVQRNALSRSEARFRAMIETTSDWVWEADREGTLIYCSPVSERIFDFTVDELLGKNMFAALRAKEDNFDYEHIFLESVKAGACFQAIEHPCRHRDGSTVYIESSGTPVVNDDGQVVGFRGIDRDITARIQADKERLNLEEQMRHTQKLEALGTLAGGVAHDMNNILTPIMGYCELAHLTLDADHPMQPCLEGIDKSAKRAANLIRQILAFSRKQVMEKHLVNLTTLIEDFAKMLKRLIREDVGLKFDLDDELWTIRADVGQLEQIILNLVVNARDALEAEADGKIIVRTRCQDVEAPLIDIDLNRFNGQYIVLSVTDNGSGIDKKIMKNIFDPFYTTKAQGKGTGMGLATIHGIVRQHNGHIRVESTKGKGATFYIYFPRTKEEKAEVELTVPIGKIVGGSETILLVEDDSVVREIATQCLIEMGYRVLTAENGKQGLALFMEKENEIDLVLSDLVMPSMGGQAMAAAIKEIKPQMPIVFMTGYASDQELLSQDEVTLLMKPFQTHELAGVIRRTLMEG